jgi:hypothetical protein
MNLAAVPIDDERLHRVFFLRLSPTIGSAVTALCAVCAFPWPLSRLRQANERARGVRAGLQNAVGQRRASGRTRKLERADKQRVERQGDVFSIFCVVGEC